jgi:hypothetical protein
MYSAPPQKHFPHIHVYIQIIHNSKISGVPEIHGLLITIQHLHPLIKYLFPMIPVFILPVHNLIGLMFIADDSNSQTMSTFFILHSIIQNGTFNVFKNIRPKYVCVRLPSDSKIGSIGGKLFFF